MKTIPLVWLLGIACLAEDPRWQRVTTDRYEGEVYLDMESVRRTGEIVEFWEAQRYKSALMYNNVVYDEVNVHYEMTCGSHDVRPTAYVVKLHGNALHGDVRSYGHMPLTSDAGVEIAFRRFCTDPPSDPQASDTLNTNGR
jgi:hypothetical protein